MVNSIAMMSSVRRLDTREIVRLEKIFLCSWPAKSHIRSRKPTANGTTEDYCASSCASSFTAPIPKRYAPAPAGQLNHITPMAAGSL